MKAIKQLSLLKESFEKDMRRTIKREYGDSAKKDFKTDTLYGFTRDKYQIAYGRFTTIDKEFTCGMVGVGNFSDEYPPTYMFTTKDSLYLVIDSTKFQSDSLLMFGKIWTPKFSERFTLGFYTKSDPSEDPWTYVSQGNLLK